MLIWCLEKKITSRKNVGNIPLDQVFPSSFPKEYPMLLTNCEISASGAKLRI